MKLNFFYGKAQYTKTWRKNEENQRLSGNLPAAASASVLKNHKCPIPDTALFSNTARAHELGTLRDWVVIYRDDHNGAGQWTVVTARYGALQGKRVVRGRENECTDYYNQAAP